MKNSYAVLYANLRTIKKTNNNFKMGKRFKQTFLWRRHTNDQQAHEKRLSLISHRGDANQNHELLFHNREDGYYQKDRKWPELTRVWESWNPHTWLVGM